MRLLLGLTLSLFFANGCGSNRSPATTARNSQTQTAGTKSNDRSAAIGTASPAEGPSQRSQSERESIESRPESSTTESATTSEVAISTPDTPVVKEEVPKAQPVDMTRYYHVAAEPLSQSDRYPWRDVPWGAKALGNVPLEIGGQLTLWGAENTKRGANYPESLTGIEIDRRFESLYLYHATFFPCDDGTPILNVVLRYDDGTSTEHEVCYGTDVRDWYASKTALNETTEPRSKRVWHGPSSLSKSNPPQELQFFLTELTNPAANRLVKTVDLISLKSQSAPCILAISTGPAGQIKVE